MEHISFDDNRLLRAASQQALDTLSSDLDRVHLKPGEVLNEPGQEIKYVYFPVSGVISLVSPQLDGNSPELATIGREGVVGAVTAIGSRKAYGRWLIQIEASAYRCSPAAFEQAFRDIPDFRQLIVCYFEAQLSQSMQSVACNAVHSVKARYARWILMMADRSSEDRLNLTQDFLAQMLAVHRSSVVEAAGALQKAGILRTGRGTITITDRKGLENAACACYGLVRNRYEELLPGTFAH